jgi:hypothetical protein
MKHRGRPVFHAPLTAASILVLLAGIEKRAPADPALASFRGALVRKGREAKAAAGSDALSSLLRQIADADPERAEVRTAMIRVAWADLLPSAGGGAPL